MRQKRRLSFFAQAGGLLAAGICLGVLVAVALVNYRAAIALLIGGGAVALWMLLTRWIKKPFWRFAVPTVIAVVVLVGGFLLTSRTIPLSSPIAGEPEEAQGLDPFGVPEDEGPMEETPSIPIAGVTGYHMIIQPTLESHIYIIEQEITFDVFESGTATEIDVIHIVPSFELRAVRRGFLLWEVAVSPVGGRAGQPLPLDIPGGGRLDGQVCRGSACVPSRIELRDFPGGTFYAARDAISVERQTFLDTETLSWSVSDLRRPIVFVYIARPFHILRPVLEPFLGASNLGEWFIAVVGMLGTLIAFPLIRIFVEDWTEKRLVDGARYAWDEGRKRISRGRQKSPPPDETG